LDWRAESMARAYGNHEEVDMSGSEHIDPQMIRDRDGDVEALNQAIRDIEAEALKQQDRLSLARPKEQERQRWWRRPRGNREAGPQAIDRPGPDAVIVEPIHDTARKVIHTVEVDSVDQGTGPAAQVIDTPGGETLEVDARVRPDMSRVIEAEALMTQARAGQTKRSRLSRWLHGT
jgi:hypothetical protein